MTFVPESDEEVSRVLIEEPQASKSRRWYWAGGAVALLAVVGLVAKASSSGLVSTKDSKAALNLDEVERWEDLPGMDGIIRKAQALKPPHPLRNLNDLFYDSQPEELPWIRTECVIDTVQGAAYLAQAVVFLYKAIDYDGLRCPRDSPAACAASVAGFLTSISWVASYLSFAASACGQAVNSGALCAGDFTALMANFGEIATVGAASSEDCYFGVNAVDVLTGPAGPTRHVWSQFLPPAAQNDITKISKIQGHKRANVQRGMDLTQCVVDVTNSAAYIVRVILQIRTAAAACPDPKACAINIMNIISSFAWISQFTALAVADCSVAGDQKALCTADISDMVAALTNGPAAGIASTSDCADLPDPAAEEMHMPMD
mmetsp:Transcript_54482/g.121909  ORF Transcript_54482/g.121909 Transcript_54482/m.121909 type:complete len:374 (-) Transcript_54482:393-1514(-)